MHICRAFDLESGQPAAAPQVIVLSFTDMVVVVKYGSCDLVILTARLVGRHLHVDLLDLTDHTDFFALSQDSVQEDTHGTREAFPKSYH
jgi:hypothetical protein